MFGILIQVVKENKEHTTVSEPPLAAILDSVLCYCIIVLLDSVQKEVRGEKAN